MKRFRIPVLVVLSLYLGACTCSRRGNLAEGGFSTSVLNLSYDEYCETVLRELNWRYARLFILDELREWAARRLAEHDGPMPVQLPFDVHPPVRDLEEFKYGLIHMYALYSGTTGGDRIQLMWGSGRAAYGLLVGDSSFTPGEDYKELHMKRWAPGVYIFYAPLP